ncbi:putative WD40 domain-containing protein [Encephalitozoon intestinalis ATCC 50506]|uniref:WD40 domain-containing protein n=1 Tax=Encephalitozoon intestinalis (strain ATCC 50506) TaxID=876142 RepID=E0S8T3_ENCIT|nr:putative WD40 domain-containing protein [Encephalitozoon intestinalis ATCC 50506]ADM12050.1 putative WD40 domain-containing protein [Encephalitozoon intestinalis ATCC 50506]UTX45840.1 WD40 domain-containing protein [Encephalitozoon intestinalis]
MSDIEAFVAFYEHLKSQGKGDSELRSEELERAMREMLRRAKITDFKEYARSYKYKRRELSGFQEVLVWGKRNSIWNGMGDMFRSSMELLGHSGQVDRICFDQGNRFFMSGGSDGMIKLWDIYSGLLVYSFIGHRNLVSDLCVSSDGKVLVSCDSHGLLSIWSLERFEMLLQLELECEIVFTEFFDTDDLSTYNLIVVLSKGVIKTYRFDERRIVSESENLCLLDESIKGLCFTDGGRFLLCSGWWPFLVVFDTQNSDGCIVLETNGMPVNTICGSKKGLKIAAACDSQIFQWTFFAEGNPGMGNFKRRTKDTSLEGHWKRSITKIDIGENESIERICYLRDNFLVCICTDLKIRIFAGSELRCIIDIPEMGIAYPHPLENIFALCGSSLRIYSMDKLIYEEMLSFAANDGQFSNDGEFFVFGDERGVVRVLSMSFLPKPPKEQFFESDLDHLNSTEWNGVVECRRESTYESDRKRNEDWFQVEYAITKKSNDCVKVEDLGSKHFVKDFVGLEAFRKKYMNIPLPGETQSVEQTMISEYSSSILEGDTSSGFYEESTDMTGDEEILFEDKGAPVRRSLVISDESSEMVPVLRRNTRVSEDVENDLSPTGIVRRLRRFNRDQAVEDEENGIRILSLEGGDGMDRRGAEHCAGPRSSINDSERSELAENSDDRYVIGLSGGIGHGEQELRQYVQSWLSSPSMVPQPGDVVYLNSEGLREFQMFDGRKKFKGQEICSGYYEVRSLEAVRYSPPFLKVGLGLRDESFSIRYYRYPGSSPVLLLREQMNAGAGDFISFVSNGIISRGRVSGVRGIHLVVDSGGTSVLVERLDMLIPRALFPGDMKTEMLKVLRQRRMHRGLYVTLRRESNPSYYENATSTVNLGIIEEKILHDLYRTIGGLEFDLDMAVSNSLYLGPVLHEHCQQAVEGVRTIIRRI